MHNHDVPSDGINGSPPPPDRGAAAAGLAFVALLLVSILTSPSGADSSSPASAITSYYARHHTADLRSDYLSLIAFPLLVGFLVGLTGRLSAGRRGAASVLVILGTLGIGFELAATAIELSLATAIHRVAPPEVVSAFFQVASRLFFVSTLLMGLALLCVLLADLPVRTLPRWTAALALVGGLLMVLSGLSAANPHGPLSIALLPGEVLFLAFVASGSVDLLRPSAQRRVAVLRSTATARQ